MSLTPQDIRRLGELSRIRFDDAEQAALLVKLNQVFDIIEQLRAVDTRGVVPMTHPQASALRQRDDYELLLRGCIDAGIACGELRPVDAAIAGRLLLSGLNQLSRWHRPGGALLAREVIDQYLDIVLLGLVNRAGPAAAVSTAQF